MTSIYLTVFILCLVCRVSKCSRHLAAFQDVPEFIVQKTFSELQNNQQLIETNFNTVKMLQQLLDPKAILTNIKIEDDDDCGMQLMSLTQAGFQEWFLRILSGLAEKYLHISFKEHNVTLFNEDDTVVHKFPNEFSLSGTAIAATVISSLFLLLVILATAYDFALIKYGTADEFASGDAPKRHLQVEEYTPLLNQEQESLPMFHLPKPGLAGKLLLSFSLCTNLRKLMDTTDRPGSINSVHGIRFISMTWVILTHTYYFGLILGVFDNVPELYPIVKRWSFQVIINASFSVDTFFLLSGLLMMYLFMMENERSEKGMTPFKWVMFYVHRYLRLTPAYLLILMAYNWLTPYLADGPVWPQNEQFDPNCGYWWTNALYINNVVHSDKECMGWSWYLSNDMQFHWISPLILVPFLFSQVLGWLCLLILNVAHLVTTGVLLNHYSFPALVNRDVDKAMANSHHWAFGSAMLLILLLGTLLTTGLIVAHYGFQPVQNLDTPQSEQGNFFDDVYIKPWCRLGPYLIGMAYGYVIYKTKRKPRINWAIALVGWAVAAVCCLSVLFGLHDYYNNKDVPQGVLNLYNTVSREVWAIGVGWVVFACACGYGGFVDRLLSWKCLIPLSRLTYCAYLIHPVVMFTMYLSLQKTLRYTDYFIVSFHSALLPLCTASLLQTNLYFCNLVMSYLWAVVFSMLFEAPFIGLERTLLRNK